jgi:hypothetical protein
MIRIIDQAPIVLRDMREHRATPCLLSTLVNCSRLRRIAAAFGNAACRLSDDLTGSLVKRTMPRGMMRGLG